MATPIQSILASFDALPDADKHVAAVEILRRYPAADQRDLSDQALTELADQLFCDLDAAEVSHGDP